MQLLNTKKNETTILPTPKNFQKNLHSQIKNEQLSHPACTLQICKSKKRTQKQLKQSLLFQLTLNNLHIFFPITFQRPFIYHSGRMK